MSTFASITELSRMTPSELRKELQLKRAEMAKKRLGLSMQSEKNSAAYKALRKEVARMTMVLCQLEKSAPVLTSQTKVADEVSKEKPSQAKKKSVKDTGSKSKKS